MQLPLKLEFYKFNFHFKSSIGTLYTSTIQMLKQKHYMLHLKPQIIVSITLTQFLGRVNLVPIVKVYKLTKESTNQYVISIIIGQL